MEWWHTILMIMVGAWGIGHVITKAQQETERKLGRTMDGMFERIQALERDNSNLKWELSQLRNKHHDPADDVTILGDRHL
jgi:hypothetical protein